jgi:hypothetical protein
MYDLLTTEELIVLQYMLYYGTKAVYNAARLTGKDPDWFEHYRPLHTEVAHAFIEAGTELVRRLDHSVEDDLTVKCQQISKLPSRQSQGRSRCGVATRR